MTTKKNVKKVEIKKGEVGNVAKVGFGLTAAAATVAGAYFLYGSKKAAQNRKKVKGWALKAKGEVLEALENAQNISEEEFKKLVETASSAYGTVKSATKGEVEDFKKEMSYDFEIGILPKLNTLKTLKDCVNLYSELTFGCDNLKRVISENNLSLG